MMYALFQTFYDKFRFKDQYLYSNLPYVAYVNKERIHMDAFI